MEFEQSNAEQAQGTRSYEGSPWIHLSEWMIQERKNRETGEPFWSVRLPDNTVIRHDGQTIDVSTTIVDISGSSRIESTTVDLNEARSELTCDALVISRDFENAS